MKKFIKEYLEPIVIAILIALFIRTFVVQAFKIPSSSMEPTLLVGDYLLVNKFIYGLRIPYTNIKLFNSRNLSEAMFVYSFFLSIHRRILLNGSSGQKGKRCRSSIAKYISIKSRSKIHGDTLQKGSHQNTSRQWKILARSLSRKILYLF
jgi:hypothetical protein